MLVTEFRICGTSLAQGPSDRTCSVGSETLTDLLFETELL
jgi:hypothetical protein